MSTYERFTMEPRESIQEICTRLTNITNEIVSLGRNIPIDEEVGKVLQSILQDIHWSAIVTTIQDSKDFTKFNLEELAGSLMTHKLYLRTTDNYRNKGLTLKAYQQEDLECDEEQAAVLVRRFKNIFMKNRNGTQRNSWNKKP